MYTHPIEKIVCLFKYMLACYLNNPDREIQSYRFSERKAIIGDRDRCDNAATFDMWINLLGNCPLIYLLNLIFLNDDTKLFMKSYWICFSTSIYSGEKSLEVLYYQKFWAINKGGERNLIKVGVRKYTSFDRRYMMNWGQAQVSFIIFN